MSLILHVTGDPVVVIPRLVHIKWSMLLLVESGETKQSWSHVLSTRWFTLVIVSWYLVGTRAHVLECACWCACLRKSVCMCVYVCVVGLWYLELFEIGGSESRPPMIWHRDFSLEIRTGLPCVLCVLSWRFQSQDVEHSVALRLTHELRVRFVFEHL